MDVSGLETQGMRKCDEGLLTIQRCDSLMRKADLSVGEKSQLRGELERGKTLLVSGMDMLDEANQKTQGQNKYNTTQYVQALKLARSKLLEIGSK